MPGLVIAIAAAKCLLWPLSLPPWYGPDEPAHFAYVQVLAIEHVVPAGGGGGLVGLPPEVICSMERLGYRGEALFFAEPPWGPDTPPACAPTAGDARLPQRLVNPAGDYLPTYYGLGVLAWDATARQPVEVRLHAVRMVSALLGVLATFFTYLAAFWFFRGGQAPASAAAVIFALQPMASQQFAIVSNDALLIALSAAFFWLLIRSLFLRPSARELVLLGLAGGLAYVAKPQGGLLLAAAPLPLLVGPGSVWVGMDCRQRLTRLLRGLAILTAGGGIVIAAGVAFAILVHGGAAPHPIPVAPGPHGIRTFLTIYFGNSASHLYFLFISSYWGNFAWLSVPIPVPVLIGVTAVYALAAGGLVIAVRRRVASWPQTAALTFAFFEIAALVILLELAYYLAYGEQILQGRSFLFLLPALAILLTAGLQGVVPRRCLG